MSLGEIWAVNWPLERVVGLGLPSNTIWLIPAKPLPLAASVTAVFAMATMGLSDDRLGAGTATLTTAVPDFVESAWLVATMVYRAGGGSVGCGVKARAGDGTQRRRRVLKAPGHPRVRRKLLGGTNRHVRCRRSDYHRCGSRAG